MGFIELVSYKVGCCTDNFNPAGVRLFVRISADKSRQKGMMDVDQLVFESRDKIGGENTHELSQNDIIETVLIDLVDKFCFKFVSGQILMRDVVEWDFKFFCKGT